MSQQAVIITVDCEANEGHEEEVRDYLLRAAVESMKEPECTLFDVCQDNENPRRFFLYEVYRNDAAFDFHKTTEHFAEWGVINQAGKVKVHAFKKMSGALINNL